MSSLNDLEMMNLKNLLRNVAGLPAPAWNRTLLENFNWTTELVDEVTATLLQNPATESGVDELVTWANFLNMNIEELNGDIVPTLQHEFISSIFWLFMFRAAAIRVPFKFWADIAPHLFDEARRFAKQEKPWMEYAKHDLNWTPVEEKCEWLKTNPESAAIYQQWSDSSNMFT